LDNYETNGLKEINLHSIPINTTKQILIAFSNLNPFSIKLNRLQVTGENIKLQLLYYESINENIKSNYSSLRAFDYHKTVRFILDLLL
jgi:hypothetical protein